MNANTSVRAEFDSASGFDFAYVLPVVIHAPGAENTNWRSSVVCLNYGDSYADLVLSLATPTLDASAFVSISAGAILEWPDIVVSILTVSRSM